MSSQRSLYIIWDEKSFNSEIVTIGLMKFLKKSFKKVGYFRPIVNNIDDPKIDLILNHFRLKQTKDRSYGYSIDQIKNLIATNDTHKIYEYLVQKYNELQKEYDFILIDGEVLSNSIDPALELEIVKNLNTSIVLGIDGYNRSTKDIIEKSEILKQHISNHSCDIFAIFVNNIKKSYIQECRAIFSKEIDILSFFLPYNKKLNKLTLFEIYNNIDLELYFGSKKRFNHQIDDIKIGSMGVDDFLESLNKGDLVVVSGDRSDIILSTLYSLYSHTIPQISGIVLTNGKKPSKIVSKLLKGIKDIDTTILTTKKDILSIAMDIKDIKPTITEKDYTKLSIVYGMFSKYVDSKLLHKKLDLPKIDTMTPIMFEYNIFEKAKIKKRNIVLNESYDDRILRATEILLNYKVVDITLLGDKEIIKQRALTLGINIDKATIIDPKDKILLDIFAKEFYNIRKSKGLLLDQAYEIILSNDIYFATMMVKLGYADGMVSGAVGTTANTIRPALQIIKTKKDIDIVSSLFFICLDTKVLVYADCAINPSPNSKELAQIALSTAQSAKQFGIDPKVAMLSYSTGDSGSGADVDLVVEATKIVKEKNPDLLVEGPIQYDAAIDKETSLKKLPNSKLKGDATVLIFPDLNTGNNTYKAVQRSSGAVAIGPILQGLNKPVNDLSRGCKVVDIINTVAITAIQVSD